MKIHNNEQCILASILIENKVLRKAKLHITPMDFTDIKHQLIYSAMLLNDHNNKPNDFITVNDNLGEVDYLGYLMELDSLLPTAENIDAYIEIQREHINSKMLQDTFKQIVDNKLDSTNAIDKIKTTIDSLHHIDNTQVMHITKNLDTLVNNITDGKKIESVPTLYKLLDNKVKIRKGNLVILASRPAVGKTTYMLNLVNQFAKQEKKVLMISLEMSQEELIERMLSLLSGVDATTIRDRNLTNAEKRMLYGAKQQLEKYDINIYDKTLTVESLVNTAHNLRVHGKLDLLLVDYLGLLDTKVYKGDRVNQLSHISRTLKNLAMELEIPIIALHQLNRNAIDHDGTHKEPHLANLKGSGAIEQDANTVLFLHQKKETDLPDRFLKLIIAKNRGGEIGKIDIVFKTKQMRFVETEFNDGKFEENNIFD